MTRHRWIAHRLFAAMLLLATAAGLQAQTLPPAVEPPAAPLTVDEAVAFALQHNPAVDIAAENVLIARDQVTAARASGLPSAGVQASATYLPSATPIVFEGNTIGGEKLNTSAQASVTQPVWPPTRWRAPVEAARANVGINEESLARTRQQVAFQTRQAFFQLLTAQELRGVAQYSVTVAETQLRLANVAFNAGTVPRLDIFQAEATLEDARVNLVRAENNVDVARAALATQLGLPAGVPVAITPPAGLPVAPAQVEPLVVQAYAVRPELQQLNFRRQQLRANIELIRLQQQPLVDVGASYNQTITGGSLFGSDGLAFTGAVTLNLFNGGRTRAEVAAAQKQLAQVDTLAAQTQLGISFEVRQAWLNLQNALRQLTAAQKQSDAAEEALRIAELRYREGEGIQLEVEQARLRRTQALTSLAQARFQAQVAAAQLEFAIGAPPATPE